MLWFILCVILCIAIYKYGILPLNYFKERNVPFKQPLPLIGNMLPVILGKLSFIDIFIKFYNDFPNKRYSGVFQFSVPVLMIRDIELIKKIAIKDFDHFTDHLTVINEDFDPLIAKNLVSLKGQKWKDIRTILSPAFTTSKMKAMFYLMTECSKEFVNFYLAKDEKNVELDIKEAFSRFGNDVIASAAFGVSCNSFKDPDNTFFTIGKDLTNTEGWRGIKIMLISLFPQLMKIFRLKVFPEAANFFAKIVYDAIKVREKENIVRPDMIYLLMQAKKGKLRDEDDASSTTETGFATVEESNFGKTHPNIKEELTDTDIAAQALLFFFAGFDSAATVSSFLAYELAINVDVQEKLQKEIDEVLENNTEVNYETLLKMKYLDMVVSETLRKWSAPALERMCIKDYVIEPENEDESPLIIKKGESINIATRGLHYDEKYFPNPEKFDPERFSDENKSNIVPYSYLPFGIGPRNCIGSRFALLQMKIMTFYLLRSFNIVPTKDTCIPIKLAIKLRVEPINGFKLGLQKRIL